VPRPAIVFPRNGDVVRAGLIDIRGTCDPGLEIEVLDNDSVAGATSVSEGGEWLLPYNLAEGDHSLVARVAGIAGTESEPVRVSVISGEAECVPVTPPAESACPPDPPYGEDRGNAWVVGRCETLGLIATRAGVSVADILTVNPEICNPDLIWAGQVLALPPRE
jgi:hypothetical protein